MKLFTVTVGELALHEHEAPEPSVMEVVDINGPIQTQKQIVRQIERAQKPIKYRQLRVWLVVAENPLAAAVAVPIPTEAVSLAVSPLGDASGWLTEISAPPSARVLGEMTQVNAMPMAIGVQ